jgi:REP element-mobilizing transposase RayT
MGCGSDEDFFAQIPSALFSTDMKKKQIRLSAYPLAYLITFSCYGARLHGDPMGSVDRRYSHYGTPNIPPNIERLRSARSRMVQSPYTMDSVRRGLVLKTMLEVCRYRGWMLLAAHVRTNHVHSVVQAETIPEPIMDDFKEYSSRKLNQAGLDFVGRRRWTPHGSTQYLWTESQVEAAIHYVLHEQGEPMEVYDFRSDRSEPRP